MLLLYPAANRDERVFAEPHRFDVTREPNPHVAFGGYGAHFCLGASLARLELRVMFEELMRRAVHLELASDDPPPLRAVEFHRRHRDACRCACALSRVRPARLGVRRANLGRSGARCFPRRRRKRR